MRILGSSLTGLASLATLMAVTATPATSQPSALAFGQADGAQVQLIDDRDRRNGHARRDYRSHRHYHGPYYAPYVYYGPYYGPYYYPYYRPYYGPSVSFSFGF